MYHEKICPLPMGGVRSLGHHNLQATGLSNRKTRGGMQLELLSSHLVPQHTEKFIGLWPTLQSYIDVYIYIYSSVAEVQNNPKNSQ